MGKEQTEVAVKS